MNARRRRTTTSARPSTAAVMTAGSGASAFTASGFIQIKIGDQEFTLRGTVDQYIVVSYHKPYEHAVSLGKLPDMMGQVGTALGLDGADFTTKLNAFLTGLEAIPGLAPVAKILKTGIVKVTDLGIDTKKQEYAFGFGVDCTQTLATIPIAAFGVTFTYTKPSA
ncbi:MAG: hypothetical protein R2745_13105 [Vicinamibacterales bacterium]